MYITNKIKQNDPKLSIIGSSPFPSGDSSIQSAIYSWRTQEASHAPPPCVSLLPTDGDYPDYPQSVYSKTNKNKEWICKEISKIWGAKSLGRPVLAWFSQTIHLLSNVNQYIKRHTKNPFAVCSSTKALRHSFCRAWGRMRDPAYKTFWEKVDHLPIQ